MYLCVVCLLSVFFPIFDETGNDVFIIMLQKVVSVWFVYKKTLCVLFILFINRSLNFLKCFIAGSFYQNL